MALPTNEQLLEQLRAIGWTEADIARDYPDLLPFYFTSEATTLYERLLSIGWTEEAIREQHPEILPESEGGVLESVGGEPPEQYVFGGVVTEPIARDDPSLYVDLGPGGGPVPVPSIASNQTADLLSLAILFL